MYEIIKMKNQVENNRTVYIQNAKFNVDIVFSIYRCYGYCLILLIFISPDYEICVWAFFSYFCLSLSL